MNNYNIITLLQKLVVNPRSDALLPFYMSQLHLKKDFNRNELFCLKTKADL